MLNSHKIDDKYITPPISNFIQYHTIQYHTKHYVILFYSRATINEHNPFYFFHKCIMH